MRRTAMVLAAVLGLAACGGTDPGGEQFLAVLSGGNDVPPNFTTLAGATVNFTARGGAVDYVISVQNISGVTDAGIHVGAAGAVGPLVFDLYAGGTTGSISSAVLATGTITASGLTALSLDSLKTLMRAGGAYVDITTVSQPGGEIRGQIHSN